MKESRIEYYKSHCANMIPHVDPEYASKLTKMAKSMIEAEDKLVDILQRYKLEKRFEDLNLDLNF